MFDNKLRSLAVAAAAGIAMTLGAGYLAAQPSTAPHPSHASHEGPNLGGLIMTAKSQLNLNSSQSVMFDAAAANTKAAFQSGRALHQQVKDAMTAELAKAEPDLAAVATVEDSVRQQGATLRQSVRANWLALYATFTPEQKTVVKGLIAARVAKAEAFHQQMQNRMLQKSGATSG
jgi:Spy/CpxP family protein refolding chaperone